MTLLSKVFTTRTLVQIIFVLAAVVVMKAASSHYDFSWAAALADAVKQAHDRGILHRDIKPSNVILSGGPGPVDLTPRLTDFGLAGEPGRGLHDPGRHQFEAVEQAGELSPRMGVDPRAVLRVVRAGEVGPRLIPAEPH